MPRCAMSFKAMEAKFWMLGQLTTPGLARPQEAFVTAWRGSLGKGCPPSVSTAA